MWDNSRRWMGFSGQKRATNDGYWRRARWICGAHKYIFFTVNMKGLVTSVYWFAQSFLLLCLQNSKKDILEHFHFALDIWIKYCFAIFSLLYTYLCITTRILKHQDHLHNLKEPFTIHSLIGGYMGSDDLEYIVQSPTSSYKLEPPHITSNLLV